MRTFLEGCSIKEDMFKFVAIVVDDFFEHCSFRHNICTNSLVSLFQLLDILHITIAIGVDQITHFESNCALKQFI